MAKKSPSKQEELEVLAGEYVLGVLDAKERKDFEQLSASVTDAADAKLRWENRLDSLNDEYKPVPAPSSVKRKIDNSLFSSAAATATSSGGLWNALGFWRGLGIVGSAAAVAFGVYSTRLNESLTDSQEQLTAALEEKGEIENTLQAFEGELAARNEKLTGLEAEASESAQKLAGLEEELAAKNDVLANLETKLAESSEKLGEADLQLADAKAALEEALNQERSVLVVSLESGETDYRFLAVHEEGSDNVRMTLVSGSVDNDKDFELWLVEPEKDTVSLGVISSGKSAVELTPEFVNIFEAGGLLAVSIEQKGGSPTGVAQGPVVAVGAPQQL